MIDFADELFLEPIRSRIARNLNAEPIRCRQCSVSTGYWNGTSPRTLGRGNTEHLVVVVWANHYLGLRLEHAQLMTFDVAEISDVRQSHQPKTPFMITGVVAP